MQLQGSDIEGLI